MLTPARALTMLERHREDFSPSAATEKRAALQRLATSRLRTAGQVRRLHELLCFMRAYPDDADVLSRVEQMLARFEQRRDLRAHRTELSNDGIAGTVMGYPFFYPTAHWLSRCWPDALQLDRTDVVAGESIAKALPALMGAVESHALREARLAGYAALDAVRGLRTDATFLLDRVAAMPGDSNTREALYDLINPSCELLPGAGTPTRTTAVYEGGPRTWQTQPLRHQRPDLHSEITRAPRSIRRVSSSNARTLIDLARAAMVARNRDLDAFAYGNEADVWRCDDGDALAFVLIGMQPERRAALPAIYGGLTLKNGVPIGYHQVDFLGRSAAVSFNTFATFRGAESALTFGRLLAALHAFSGASSFNIEPYQLGLANDEGIESGAWWFYFKLGFRPRDRAASSLAAAEARRLQARGGYRSSTATLRRLAQHHLFLDLDPRNPAPLLLPTKIGLHVAASLADLVPGDRSAAEALAEAAARRRLAPAALNRATRDQRTAWRRLAPLFAALPLTGWSDSERADLATLARTKGARSERAYVRLSARHLKLETALARLSSTAREPKARE